MNAILMQVLITIFVGLVLAYAGYRLGLRRFQFEREIAQVDEQKKEEAIRIQGMLQYQSKIQTSANLANTNQDNALGLLRESRAWFDANCISYLKEEPYKSFDFVLKTPLASQLLLKAIGKPKGSGKNLVSKAGVVTKAQVREIAEIKMPDLNANDIDAAMRIIEGTARSMGIEVK